ncbi:MAG: glucose-1-phosphate adenylyltransferase [Candidatus Zixiibacteriota bacterium]|nr:MAG: glucose-1-phosphate adenylyltransferase [candidate division Zixibacteria bacterium]
MQNVLGIILGGGEGKRLYPLTKHRSKPAVPIAGKYRLIDIPVSNCIHSGIERIFILTQFNSESLNRHILLTYKFDGFHEGFVTILAAEQTMESMDWFQGTADAVRKSVRHFERHVAEDYLILAGDHIYQMDYRQMIDTHRRSRADVTLAVSPITPQEAEGFGVMRVDASGRVVDFLEKPKPGTDLSPYEVPGELRDKIGLKDPDRTLLGSMGVYLFRRPVLHEALKDHEKQDFGKHIIPAAIHSMRTQAHFFDGYWRDVGTIGAFFDANMDLLSNTPEIRLFNEPIKIYTHSRFLPGSKILGVEAECAIICEGCILEEASLRNALIGVRTIVQKGARIENTYIMGADYYDRDPEAQLKERDPSWPALGIGEDCVISGAIVDKNARIGRGVRINPKQPHENYAGHGYMVRDGITVIEKDAVIPDGAVI